MSANGRHLAYVLKRFPRISETFVAAELIELERQGERVTVYAVSKPAEAFSHGFLDELRAEVIYLPYRPIREPGRVARAVVRQARRRPGSLLRAAREGMRRPSVGSWRMLLQATVLRDEMERAGIDHAHAHFATSAADLASLVWHMDGPSYSVTAHAKDIWHEQVRRDDLRRKLGHAAFVATVSEQNRDYLSSILDDGERVRVVPNSVDLRRMGDPGVRAPEPFLVVSVARLIEKKGLDDLVAACGLLHARGVPVRSRSGATAHCAPSSLRRRRVPDSARCCSERCRTSRCASCSGAPRSSACRAWSRRAAIATGCRPRCSRRWPWASRW